MKAQPLFSATAVLLLCLMLSCTNEPPAPTAKVDNWTKEEVMKKIEGEWKLVQVRRVSGADTVVVILPDFAELNPRAIFKIASNDVLSYLLGATAPVGRTPFPQYYVGLPPRAEIFVTSLRSITEQAGVKLLWDETLNTVVFKSRNGPSYFPRNRTAVLDPASLFLYDNLEAAKAGTKPTNMTVIAEEEDPQLGKVKYLFELRKLWFLANFPSSIPNSVLFVAL